MLALGVSHWESADPARFTIYFYLPWWLDIENTASRAHWHDVYELPVHPHRRLAIEFP